VANVLVAHSTDHQIGSLVREAGLAVAATLPIGDLATLERSTAKTADVLIIDVRGRGSVPAEVSSLKRRHPKMGILLIAPSLDTNLMLEAMRAGVTEVITDPVSSEKLRGAVERLMGQFLPKVTGEVLAFVGAKGGVGTTTLAVNLATALAADRKSPVILVDLHTTTYGDAALLAGVDPRFSVLDAIENINRLDEAYIKGLVTRTEHHLDLLAAPDQPSARPLEMSRLKALLQKLIEMYRWVVLDVPHSDLALIDGLDPVFAATLVVTQELPALRHAAKLGALLQQRYGTQRVSMVISRFDAGADYGSDDIQKNIGLPVWGLLPADYKRVVAAANLGKPIVNDSSSRVGVVVKQLANKFVTTPRPETDKSSTARRVPRIAGLI
jgi:pilus assembly protein CpaE